MKKIRDVEVQVLDSETVKHKEPELHQEARLTLEEAIEEILISDRAFVDYGAK